MHESSPTRPECPRCGYDQSGEVARWDAVGQCPVQGVCPECGLRFLWCDLCDPKRAVAGWSFEHTRAGRVAWARSLVYAVLRSLWPWWLWRAGPKRWLGGRPPLTMSAPIIAPRLLQLCAVALISFVAVLAASRTLWVVNILNLWPNLAAGSAPAWRGVTGTYLLNVFFGLKWPQWGWGGMAHFDGLNLFDRVLLPAVILAPCVFFTLGTTLRRAKVRREHLLRGVVYGLFPVIAALLPQVLVVGTGKFIVRTLYDFGLDWPLIMINQLGAHPFTKAASVVPVLPLLVMWWWYAVFCRHYLKLPRAGLIALAMVLIAFLASVVLCMIFVPDYAMKLGSKLI